MSKDKLLKKLYEDAGSLPVFKTRFEQAIGLHRDEDTGRQIYDPERREVSYQDFEIGRVMRTLCGAEWRNAFEQNWQRASAARFEGVGSAVLPGDLPYVSASLDVIAGLANARALEREKAPQWIWDSMATVTEIVGEGGFDIIVRANGDQPLTDLADGQAIPTVTLKGSRVHRNRTLNQGLRAKVNKYTILDDLTGTLYGAIDEVADQVLNERERKVADCVLGIGSANQAAVQMSQDGLSFFPFQSGIWNLTTGNVGSTLASPQNQKLIQNFANAQTNDGVGLQDYTFLVRSLAVLASNRDPFTGLPITVPLQGMKLFVAPRAVPQVEYIMQGQSLWQIANNGFTTSGGTATVSSLDLMKQYGIQIVTSQVWANRLTDVGIQKAVPTAGTVAYQVFTNLVADTYNTANSIASFIELGHFKEAVRYAQRLPFTTVQVPLSSVEYAEETVLVQDMRERGAPYWVNPRKVWRTYA